MANGNRCYLGQPGVDPDVTAPPSVVTVGLNGEETLVAIPQDTSGKQWALTVIDGVLSWQPFGRWEPLMYEGELLTYNGDVLMYLAED